MKDCLRILALLGATACTQVPPSADPLITAGREFRSGRCLSEVAMPDTLAPLKVMPSRVRWADENYQPAIAVYGHVVARVTIDTAGRVVPGSVVIVTSDNPELSSAYCRDLLRQRFVPYRVGEDARAVRVDQDFRMIRATRR